MKNVIKAALVAILPFSVAVSAIADTNTTASKERGMLNSSNDDTTKLMADAATVYRNIKNGPHGTVPQSVLSKAQCVAVFPDAVTAAAVVGGTHGDGVASCKTTTGKWSSPAFFDLNEASLGAQLGAKSTDFVIYFTSPESVAALKRGKFAFGADASVVAGSFDRTFDTGTAGVVAYQQSAGAFLGAAITGGKLSAEEGANRAYYGKTAEIAAVLDGRETALGKTDSFTTILP